MEDPTLQHVPLLGGEAVRFNRSGGLALIAMHCSACDGRSFPPTAICSSCGSEAVTEEEQPQEGTLYTFTTVHVAGKRWGGPVSFGYVDLTNGLRIFSHLDGEGWQAGQAVQLGLSERGAADKRVRVFVFRRKGGQ